MAEAEYAADARREHEPLTDSQFNAAAEDDAAEDMAGFSAWLAEQCDGVSAGHTRIGYVPKTPDAFERFVASLDVPQLLSLALSPYGRWVDCMEILQTKYLQAQGFTAPLVITCNDSAMLRRA